MEHRRSFYLSYRAKVLWGDAGLPAADPFGGGIVSSQLKEESQGGVALVNVDNRIRLLFGAEYGLHVYSVMGMGTTVEIALPCIVSDWDVKNPEALR